MFFDNSPSFRNMFHPIFVICYNISMKHEVIFHRTLNMKTFRLSCMGRDAFFALFQLHFQYHLLSVSSEGTFLSFFFFFFESLGVALAGGANLMYGHFFLMQACFSLFLPPNLGLSRQNLHLPQSTALHASHSPHFILRVYSTAAHSWHFQSPEGISCSGGRWQGR